MTDRLANLHLLLCANSFQRWPLKLTFYAEDVYKVWLRWQDVNNVKLRPGLQIAYEGCPLRNVPSSILETPMAEPISSANKICNIDVGYSDLQERLQATRTLFATGETNPCFICQERLPVSGTVTLVCPNTSCLTKTHLKCLASTFLAWEGRTDALVPTRGLCPKCKTPLQWFDLVKELTLRMRGEKEIHALFKPKRARKGAAIAAAADQGLSSSEESGDDALDMVLEAIDESDEFSSSSDMECGQKYQLLTESARNHPAPLTQQNYAAVIDDSDWDDVEVI